MSVMGVFLMQSILANFGILLFMHLMINTIYLFHQQRKLSKYVSTLFHILIVSIATISMYYYPIKLVHENFNLSLIPVLFIAFFHGWKFTLPVILITTSFQFLFNSSGTELDIMLGAVFPLLVLLIFAPIKRDKMQLIKPFIVLTTYWIIMAVHLYYMIDASLITFIKTALIHYFILILAGLIMNFFIFTGIKHIELLNKLRFYADHDPLTGLYNMRRFEEIVCRFSNKIHHRKMFIAMIDLDRFKLINDTFGHQTGDLAIQKVSKVIVRHCSSEVYAARYGGDEFILFLLTDSLGSAQRILESIRLQAAQIDIIPHGSKQVYKPSISVGLSALYHNEDLLQSIKQADKQLYIAKQQGRNCICS
jgi:diguanylate cyclase